MKFKVISKISQFFRDDTPCQPSRKETDSEKNIPVTEEFEYCAMCGALTCVPVSMPIDWRENYEVGMGQICAECAKRTAEEANQAELTDF